MPKIKRLSSFSKNNFHRLKRGHSLEKHYETYNRPFFKEKMKEPEPEETHSHEPQIEQAENYQRSFEHIGFEQPPIEQIDLEQPLIDLEEEEPLDSIEDQDELFRTIRSSHSLEESAAALLSFYLSGKLTQSALKTASELIKAFCPDIHLPSSVDECISILYKNVAYKKTYYCKQCNKAITSLRNDIKQRRCQDCNK